MCREGKQWSERRKKGARILIVELAAQMLNLLIFLVNNIYVLVTPCRWFTAPVFWLDFVSWMCWNTVFCTSVVCALAAPQLAYCMVQPLAHVVRFPMAELVS